MDNGCTPLHTAAGQKNIEIAELLIHAGANKHIKTKKGKTPLDTAKAKGHRDILNLLR